MALSHKGSSNSLRSLASTSSTQSGVSLQRSGRTERRRTRSRSRTVTSREALPSPSEPLPAIPPQPKEIGSVFVAEPASVNDGQPHNADSDDEGSLIAYLSSDETDIVKTPKLANAELPPEPVPEQRSAAAARIAALPEIDVSRANARISITTQESYTSHLTSGTSYYPRSSTTGTVDSLPTPSASSASSTFEPEIHEARDLDTDDVSYRLRLLVNNNYFLPPAHAKPQPSDFAPPVQDIQRKSSPFLDIFRIGKSKSKPTTPTTPDPGFDFPAPVLRTTSDSTTAGGYSASRPQAPAPAASTPSTNFLDRGPRVVVVREKMTDIVQAAKQAEEELKLREAFETGSNTRPTPSATDVIDPTDTVDLPPPSSEYPFAVQASALHGLGVDQSVGAALLAERLPPKAMTPSPVDRSDDEWRRALLHDAVSLSLHSSTNTSISFTRPVVSPGPSAKSANTSRQGISPSASIRSSGSAKQPSPSSSRPVLDQRILSHPFIESRSLSPQSPSVPPPSNAQRKRERSHTESLQSPLRAETPFAPHTPLSPAPRPRPQHAQTESSIRRSEEVPPTPTTDHTHSARSIRKAMSTPALNDVHESRMAFMMTPPPVESSHAFQSLHGSSGSVYSLEEEEDTQQTATRPSVALSMADDISVSEYSQQSPTASAFFDARSSNQVSRSSLNYQSARASPIPGRGALSPPPRMSSTTFRSASPIRHTPSPLALAAPGLGQSFLSLASDPSTEILEPEPTTPPLPVSTLDMSSDPTSDDVDVPSMMPLPGPSSPPSFFDTIQSQPNALDDLDTSDDSSDDDDELVAPRPLFGEHNSPLMRLGNHSTPQISRTVDVEADPIPSLSRGQLQRRPSDSKKPVGYIPPRPAFFTERKSHSESGHESSGPPLSTFDYYQYEKRSRRPQTSSGASVQRSRRMEEEEASTSQLQQRLKNQKSLRRLDGLVMRHLEAEKDTIRRIANTMRSDQRRR